MIACVAKLAVLKILYSINVEYSVHKVGGDKKELWERYFQRRNQNEMSTRPGF
jgi:hypothetical protein